MTAQQEDDPDGPLRGPQGLAVQRLIPEEEDEHGENRLDACLQRGRAAAR